MENSNPPISVVRQKVLAAFRALGAGNGECRETVLVKDRFVVGRRFCRGGFEAVWVVAEREIRILNENGERVELLPLEDSDIVLLKKAA